MLECARTFQNYWAIVALGQNILRHYCWREEKREGYMHRAIESTSDVILHNTRAALKETRYEFSSMVCSLPCFAIKYAASYDAVRIGLLMSTKSKNGKVAFLSNLALFILNSASVVFQYFLSPYTFRNYSLSFAGDKQNCSSWRIKSFTEDADSHHFLWYT